jgi:putative ABC transport system permease protein
MARAPGWIGQCAVIVRRRLRDTPSRFILAALGMAAAASVIVFGACVIDSIFGAAAGGLHKAGSDLVFITPESDTIGETEVRGVSAREFRAILTLPGVERAVPWLAISGSVGGCGRRLLTTVQGAAPEHFAIEGFRVDSGRSLTEVDEIQLASVVVLGHAVSAKLGCVGVGDMVDIGGRRMTVVGILRPAGTLTVTTSDDRVFIPLSRLLGRYGWPRSGSGVLLRVAAGWSADAVAAEVRRLLEARRRGSAAQEARFLVKTQAELVAAVATVRRVALTTLAGLVGMGLIAASLGVAGTMTSSVLERQSEIGLSRCVGATRNHVKAEFLVEGALIGCLGGMLGAATGAGAAVLLAYVGDLPAPDWIRYASFTTLVACASASIASAVPAMRAAALPPIQAVGLER